MKSTWTLQRCMEEALKYTNSTQWKKNYKASYNAAIRFGWIKQCTAHMTPLKGAWNTIKKCKQIAQQYNTKDEWRKLHNSSYHYAHKKNWIDFCCTHMKSISGTSSMEKELLDLIKNFYPNSKNKRFSIKDKKYVANCFEIDIFIPELNKGIEFNGRYWHSFEGLKRSHPTWKDSDIIKYHILKKDYFNSINIDIIFIEENDWRNNKKETINKVYSFIGGLCA